MAGIEQYLQNIREARYGEDVRVAIHDSIHQCYEDGKAGATDLVAREQIANLVANEGTTEKDSELVDVRVGADGTIYTSAGEAVRGQVSRLDELIAEIRDIKPSRNMFDISTAKNDTAYSTNKSGEYDAPGYMLSDFIPVKVGKTLFSSNNGAHLRMNFVHTFDALKHDIAFYKYQDTYQVEDNVGYVRVCYFGNTTNLAKLQIEYDEITAFEPYGKKEIIIKGNNIDEMKAEIEELKEKDSELVDVRVGADGTIYTSAGEAVRGQVSRLDELISVYELPDSPLSRINNCPELLSCFLNVGCIGDSLASGVAVYKDAQGQVVVNSVNRYSYSWAKFLERMTGNNYYNWSAGGLRTDTWLSSSYATECFDGTHLCQAYILGLGQNDNNAKHGSDIGFVSDIDLNNYNNNADTFYGRYAKIIQKIKEVQPKAKIFVVTDPNESVNANGYNAAIRKMAELFKYVYVIDMRAYWNDAPCATLLNNQKRYGHFNAVGYFLIAKMIMTYIDWIMQKHWEDFREIENIGTDWYYYDELSN